MPQQHSDPPHRRATLLALLMVTVFGAGLFGVLNLLRGAYGLAAVEGAMGAFAVGLMFVVRRTPYLKRWTLIYIVPFFTAMLFAFSAPYASATVFVWALLIPVISHLLLGRWLGLAVATAFLLAAGAIYLVRFHSAPELVSVIALANVAVCSLVILALSHVAEYTREQSERSLHRQATTDYLTRLANRSHMHQVFQREKDRAERGDLPVSLLLMDLDHFKSVNDRFGHDTGDAALVHVASLLRSRLRAIDLACRHGGEEFAVVLVESDLHAAEQVAETLRAELADRPFSHGGRTIPLTVSIGVAELGRDGPDLDRLLSRADARLFEAKRRGRNCVVADSRLRKDGVPHGIEPPMPSTEAAPSLP